MRQKEFTKEINCKIIDNEYIQSFPPEIGNKEFSVTISIQHYTGCPNAISYGEVINNV